MVTKTEESKKKKQWGYTLVIVPIVIWSIVAMVNGFDFSRPWLGKGMDLLLGFLGLVIVVIGIVMIATADTNK